MADNMTLSGSYHVITFTLVQIDNSYQTLKKNSKISHFCLLPFSFIRTPLFENFWVRSWAA